MAHQTHNPDSNESDALIADVWSRTESKYRRRAVVLLIINVCLFAGLGSVAYWLRTGVVFAPADENYWEQLAETFHPTPNTTITPTGLPLGPVSIEHVPMMMPVIGLILAALISIPVLIAILYRLPCALPFIGVVGFIAVMPWLAIALTGGCVLASVRPFRFRSRFASALMSLLPVILYFFMASRQTSPVLEVLSNPADRVKLVTPLILAIIASAVVMGIVLIIARIVNYRPGAIAPLLAILFLTPAALFEFQVGRDELYYRLLERDFGSGSQYFVGEEVRDLFDEAVESEWARRRDQGVSFATARELVEMKWSLALDAEAGLLFSKYKDRAARAADRFVFHFPDSVYAYNALYIKGRALDMRIDLDRLSRDHEIVYYEGFPSARSRRAWELIEAGAPQSPIIAVALLHLAKLDMVDDQIDRSLGRLARLERVFGDGIVADGPGEPIDAILQRKPPESTLDIALARTVFDGRKLKALLEDNRDPRFGDLPLVTLARCDPTHRRYTDNLHRLLDRFPGCELTDNIELKIAQSATQSEHRIEKLESCVSRLIGGDALPEAIYALGTAYQQVRELDRAREAFGRVVAEFGDSIWRSQAESWLRRIDRGSTEGS